MTREDLAGLQVLLSLLLAAGIVGGGYLATVGPTAFVRAAGYSLCLGATALLALTWRSGPL